MKSFVLSGSDQLLDMEYSNVVEILHWLYKLSLTLETVIICADMEFYLC